MAGMRDVATVTRRRVAGVVLLALILGFGGLTYAFFDKSFTDSVPVPERDGHGARRSR